MLFGATGCDAPQTTETTEPAVARPAAVETEEVVDPAPEPSRSDEEVPDLPEEPDRAALEAACFAGDLRACDSLGH